MSDSNFKKPALFAAATALLIFGLATPLLPQQAPPAPARSQTEVDSQSVGCVSCHGMTEAASMHPSGTVHIGCAFCHGGNPGVMRAEGDAAFKQAKQQAHPKPRIPEIFQTAANAVRPYAKWLDESEEYIRFVNPGDLRVAEKTCGSAGCHVAEVRNVSTSMMTHGGMLWGAALYNNGAFPLKNANFGESYAADGSPRRINMYPPPTLDDTLKKGILPFLEPLARWEVSQPGNILRVFERGGFGRVEIGNPGPESEAGRPDDKLSDRGLGTQLRTDPVFLGLQKTRLLDPLLSQPGTNDHAGDYRQSGCTACHVIYANDRSPVHSAQYAGYGNQGRSAQSDPTISKTESGHPIKHEFTRSIPTSQCIVCHIHPGTNMVASYLGLTWWDSETDGKVMYPEEQRKLTDDDRFKAWQQNPQGAAARGLWIDNDFLKNVGTPEFNSKLENTQFADFNGHGWVYRAVYKRDRKGNLLDAEDKVVPHEDPNKFDKAVHLMDIHLEKGMHCTDCHFQQDSHGNGNLYGETRNAVEIDCVDCHGTIKQKATLMTSAAAAPRGGTNMALSRTGTGERRFYWESGKLFQRSSVEPNKQWEVVQVMDTITPGNDHYSEASRLAKTLLKDNKTWGSGLTADADLAHSNSRMTCYTCHSSWTTSCFGCHLPMRANGKSDMTHNEGLETRNYTQYNFDVLRDDIYMLGVDGTVTGNRIAPTRSTCAVVVSSQNANRDWMYYQQQTISAEGFSGFGFSSYYPHTVRAKETKTCTSCHISKEGDNNAWMAQILMQGTNLVNQMGRFVYVAEGNKGLEAVTVAERDDPGAVFGSDLHQLAYPEDYDKLVNKKHRELEEADHHAGNVLDLQLRGEYLYAALGKDGFRIYDVANIENKNFSEKITTAPSSPLGQKFYVKTKNATAIASPSTLAVDPLRTRLPENQEQPIALMYGFLYVTDSEEGLIVIGDPDLKAERPGVLTLLDGDPTNNFLKRATTFNPNGVLNGARRITIAGTYAYILTPRGLVVVDIANPLEPKVTAQIGAPDLVDPTGIAVQFRYAFVTDREGLKVIDTTNLAEPHAVRGVKVALQDARNLYVARTYAYVAGGKQGLVIVDVEKPEQPRIEEVFTAEGEIHDTRDVKLGMTAASAFAYLADGTGGMKIVQMFAPSDNPNYLGFSPKPTPKLIATYHTHGPALMLSKGIDRDRAVDESGNQIAVFNRRGSRPFNKEEAERLFLFDGKPYTVTDAPPGPPQNTLVSQTSATITNASFAPGVDLDKVKLRIPRASAAPPPPQVQLAPVEVARVNVPAPVVEPAKTQPEAAVVKPIEVPAPVAPPVVPPPLTPTERASAAALNQRGRELTAAGQMPEAIAALDEAIRLEPTMALAWNARGYVYLLTKDYKHAVDDFTEAIRLDPNYLNAFRNRALARRALGDVAGYAADIQRSTPPATAPVPAPTATRPIAVAPQPPAGTGTASAATLNQRGRALIAAGNPAGAIQALDEAIRLEPTMAQAWNGRGYARFLAKDYKGSLEDLNEAIRLDPNYQNAFQNRAYTQRALGNTAAYNADMQRAQDLAAGK